MAQSPPTTCPKPRPPMASSCGTDGKQLLIVNLRSIVGRTFHLGILDCSAIVFSACGSEF